MDVCRVLTVGGGGRRVGISGVGSLLGEGSFRFLDVLVVGQGDTGTATKRGCFG